MSDEKRKKGETLFEKTGMPFRINYVDEFDRRDEAMIRRSKFYVIEGGKKDE